MPADSESVLSVKFPESDSVMPVMLVDSESLMPVKFPDAVMAVMSVDSESVIVPADSESDFAAIVLFAVNMDLSLLSC